MTSELEEKRDRRARVHERLLREALEKGTPEPAEGTPPAPLEPTHQRRRVVRVVRKKRKKKDARRAKLEQPLFDPVFRAGVSGRVAKPSEDAAVAALDEILASPLGQAWIQTELSPPPSILIAPGAPKEGVLAPLPRRQMLAVDPGAGAAPPMAMRVDFEAGVFAALGRLVLWLVGALRFTLGTFVDMLLSRDTVKRRAVRLRKVMENLGPSFVKLGQQLSVRADLLDYEYCEELAKMLDNVPPFPTDQAVEIIERTCGRPIKDVFAILDPTPIGSASLSCVYQGVLHNGDRVAVKVRRPGIGPLVAADLKALGWLLSLAEAATFLRPGLTQNLRIELSSMLIEELNFRQEARYTSLFRKAAHKQAFGYITAPRVYYDYSSTEVIVTELVSGVFLSEILTAIDHKDEASLQQLKEQDIDPVVVAKHMCMAFNWETIDSLVFHADPHPGNVIIRPGNVLVFIDFGSCGHFGTKSQQIWMEIRRNLGREDVQGMVDASIALLEPLPPIDVESFTKEIEQIYWDFLYALKSDQAEWWEKASGMLWLRFIGIARRYHVPVNLDTLRMFRASFLYDTLVFRLWRGLDMDDEYQRYYKRKGKQLRRDFNKAIRRRLNNGLTDDDYHLIRESLQLGRQVMSRTQRFLQAPSHRYTSVIGKAAFGAAVFLRLASLTLVVNICVVIATTIFGWFTGRDVSVWTVALHLLQSRLYQIILMIVLLVIIRRSLIRVEDVDVATTR